ncbi:MAG: FxsA family protein [Acidimicrobiales bacterium]
MALLVFLFILMPLAELAVIIQVGQSLGIVSTIGLLLLVSVVGAWMVKHQGLSVLFKAQTRMARGEVPGEELVSGLAILFAGALMLTPGFITDSVGMALLLPPFRAPVVRWAMKRWGHKFKFGGAGGPSTGFGEFYDTNTTDDD